MTNQLDSTTLPSRTNSLWTDDASPQKKTPWAGGHHIPKLPNLSLSYLPLPKTSQSPDTTERVQKESGPFFRLNWIVLRSFATTKNSPKVCQRCEKHTCTQNQDGLWLLGKCKPLLPIIVLDELRKLLSVKVGQPTKVTCLPRFLLWPQDKLKSCLTMWIDQLLAKYGPWNLIHHPCHSTGCPPKSKVTFPREVTWFTWSFSRGFTVYLLFLIPK